MRTRAVAIAIDEVFSVTRGEKRKEIYIRHLPLRTKMYGNEAAVVNQARFHYNNLQNYECVDSRIILTKPLVDFQVLLRLDFS